MQTRVTPIEPSLTALYTILVTPGRTHDQPQQQQNQNYSNKVYASNAKFPFQQSTVFFHTPFEAI